MKQNVQLANIWGIPVGFNRSWYLIFALVMWTLAARYMPEAYPGLAVPHYWMLAIITTILFFGSIIWHELAHALLALHHGIGVKRITLFLFGGVAEMEQESETPWAEFSIAAAGPLSSFIAAGVFFLIYQFSQGIVWLNAPASYLMQINLALAIFNLIPGFPLDGGRILRSIVWAYSNQIKATKIAATTGQVFAYGFMGIGVFQALSGDVASGLWIAFIGWFLNNAASVYGQQADLQSALDNVPVEEIMQPKWSIVDGNTPISHIVNEKVIKEGVRAYFVKNSGYGYSDDAAPHGMLTLTDIAMLDKKSWSLTPANQIMTAWNQLLTTSPKVPILNAVRQMDERNINQLPVLKNGQLVGVLSRENVNQYLQMQAGN
ncbi:MAG: site-2 protease family protein [Anaerolineae bacterium]